MRKTLTFDIFDTVCVELLDVRSVFVVPGLRLGRRPFFNEDEQSGLISIFEKIVADVTLLTA
jgi:hypothetical protein